LDDWIHVDKKKKSENITIETHAFEVKCDYDGADKLSTMLTDAITVEVYKARFVPYTMAKANKAGYVAQLMEHNNYLKKIRLITMFSLTEELLMTIPTDERTTLKEQMENQYLQFHDEMIGDPIIFLVERTSNSEDKGKWFVLVKEGCMEHAIEYLDNEFTNKYIALPDFEKKNKFQAPPSRKKYDAPHQLYSAAAHATAQKALQHSGNVTRQPANSYTRKTVVIIDDTYAAPRQPILTPLGQVKPNRTFADAAKGQQPTNPYRTSATRTHGGGGGRGGGIGRSAISNGDCTEDNETKVALEINKKANDELQERLNKLESRVEQKCNKLEEQLAANNAKMSQLEGIVSHMTNTIDKLMEQNKSMQKTFDSLASNQQLITQKLQHLTTMMEQTLMQKASSPSTPTGASELSSQKRQNSAISTNEGQHQTQEHIMSDPDGIIHDK
jgi:hypothetical protein